MHALTDAFCRPIAFLLTGGQVADCTTVGTLLDAIPKTGILHGDKGYDSNAVRAKVESKGTAPNIPPKVNLRRKNCFSPVLYRDRNAIYRTAAVRCRHRQPPHCVKRDHSFVPMLRDGGGRVKPGQTRP